MKALLFSWCAAWAAVTFGFEPTGCPYFVVEKPRGDEGTVLSAVDFGLSEASDKNATAINRAIAEAKRTGARGVKLAPGTYRCFDEPGVLIEDAKDFAFDGQGAVLVFRRPAEYRGQPQSEVILTKSNFLVSRSERVWVKNLVMDWDWQTDPLCDAAVVAARHIDREHPEESYIEFLLPDWERHPKYPEPMPMQKMQKIRDDRSGFCPSPNLSFGQTEGHFGAKNEWVAPNRIRLWPGVPMPGRNQNPMTGYRFSPTGNLKGVESVAEGELYRILHCYYGKNGLCLQGNRHVTVSDVTVWSCFGMGMVVDGPQEYWRVERFRVVPPTEEEFAKAYPGVRFFRRPMTSSSDGHHIARSKGHCQYVDCAWTMNNDDSNNFHDRFTIAVKCGARKLQVINRRGESYFRAEVGTEIELRRPNFDPIGDTPTGFRAKLKSVQGEILVLDREIPEQVGPCFLVWDRGYGTDNVLFKGCQMVDAGYRNLFSPSNLTIEDCAFVRTGNYPIRLISDYRANLWCEGMGTTNVVIRGCRFEDPCAIYPENPVISSVCVTPPGWEIPPPDRGFVAGDVLIEGCTFVRPCGKVLEFTTGRNVTFRNSTVDLRGVDPDRWPNAGKVDTSGVDGFRMEKIDVLSGTNSWSKDARSQTQFRGLHAGAVHAVEHVRGFLWLEAENFETYGDWEIDTQFTHKMGSAYLICPGLATPRPRAAKTAIDVPRAGAWQVWVRTKDWVPEHSPGKFALEVAGRRSPVLGASGLQGWRWEKAGAFELAAGRTEVALVDLSGAFARCDAILLTEDAAYVPPADEEPLTRERMRMTGVDQTVCDVGTYDFVVVGAGAGGMGAAVSAARLGAKVALVYDRPVPGGNGSREMGIGLDGAQMSRKGSREAGLAEEFRMRAARHRNVLGFAYEDVLAEMKDVIAGFPNERVMRVEKEGRRIAAVVSRNTLTGKWSRYRAKLFADATGDGWVAKFAGARLMYGREDKRAFGEDWTVDVADRLTMSGTVMGGCMGMRVKRVPAGAEAAPFHAPAWAKVLPCPFWRPQKHPGSDWWLENPGRIDDIDDPEGARDNLIRIAFDYWDWQCNEWEHREMTRGYCLDYVPYHNARREGMRVVGDYILTGNDCVTEKVFPDAVATGGWSCDVHDPLGMENPKSDGWNLVHKGGPGPYTVPYRMLYSADIDNLFLASRCFSMTHIALGSMRVGGSIMSAAQAVGTAAAFCLRRGLMPREYGQRHLDELRNRLFRDDLNIQWLADTDPANLALKAKASDPGLNDGIGVPEWKGGGAVANYHGWASEGKAAQLTWEKPVSLAEVGIAFDTGLKTRRVKLPMPTELVRDYAVELRADGAWREIARVTDNDLRYRVHRLPRMQADALRVKVVRTWGDSLSRILEIRAYGDVLK